MRMVFRQTLNKLIPFLVRPFDKLTAHHERNQHLVVRPDPSATLRTKGLVEGSLSKDLARASLALISWPHFSYSAKT